MSILFQTDMSGLADGTNFATQFASYWSLVSGEAKIYNESLRNAQYGGAIEWVGGGMGLVRATRFSAKMNSTGNALLSMYPLYAGVDANNLRLRHSSGTWTVTKGFTNVIQVADSAAYGARDIMLWLESLGGSDYRVHFVLDGTEYTADVSDSSWAASTAYRFGSLGSTDWAYFDDIIIATDVADLSTTDPETVDCTIAAELPAPVVSATAEILAPVAATVAAVMPAPVVSATAEILDPVSATVAAELPAPVASVTAATLEPVECTVYAMLPAPLVTCTIEFDEPDEVQVVIAAALPAPLVGIVAEVLEPLEATVAAELPAPVASATADVLEPLTASVAAGLPAPVASATGETFEPLECTVSAMLPAPVVQVVAGAEVVPVPPIVAQYIADWRAALNPATGGPGESVAITPVGGTQFTVPLAMVSRKGMVAPAELPREYAGRAGSWVVVRLLMDDLPDVPPTDSLIMVDGRGHFIRCIQPLGPQGCGVRLYAVGDQWGRR